MRYLTLLAVLFISGCGPQTPAPPPVPDKPLLAALIIQPAPDMKATPQDYEKIRNRLQGNTGRFNIWLNNPPQKGIWPVSARAILVIQVNEALLEEDDSWEHDLTRTVIRDSLLGRMAEHQSRIKAHVVLADAATNQGVYCFTRLGVVKEHDMEKDYKDLTIDHATSDAFAQRITNVWIDGKREGQNACKSAEYQAIIASLPASVTPLSR